MDTPWWLGTLLRAGSALSLLLGTSAIARAEGNDATRVAAGAGIAVPVLNRTLYGPGELVQGGADFPLGNGEAQRLRVLARWIGLVTTGARADLGLVEAAWRLYPSWGKGLLFEIGAGALFEVERLQLNLPGRAVDASNARVGMPASAAIGFGLWRRVELEVGYQQLFFIRGEPWTAGIGHASIGGRL